jgi:hypothetical protein
VFLLGHHGAAPRLAAAQPSWQGLVGDQRAQPLTGQPALGQQVIVVFHARSLADRVAAAGGEATSVQEQQWTKQARTDQHVLMQQLALRGAVLQPEKRFYRVVNAIAATVDPGTLGILQHAPEVAGIYPVRAAYPATIANGLLAGAAFGPGTGHRPDVGLRGVDGRGIEIALLDTGVDPSQPYLRGQIADGIDVLGNDPHALPATDPDDPSQVETHGTEMAGLLVGAGGPGGLAGVATGASILPIRVAGWQPTDAGGHAVYATTDDIIQGLEDAVDPNGDGDAHDAARVALVGVTEPYASFADDPIARAVEGASRLDTLVVVPAGNDGAAAADYGSIGGPGGARDGLTVGALDARVRAQQVRLVVRDGLRTLVDTSVPLGTEALRGQVSVPLTAIAPPSGEGESTLDPVPVEQFFDAKGFSLAAGRAVLVPEGGNPEAVARNAANAGARAVVLYGGALPAGAVGLDTPSAVPVVAVSADTGARLLKALKRKGRLAVLVGSPHAVANPGLGRVASFSSRGLGLGGTFKPELVARGVELATSEPGQGADGEGLYGTVSGTSASAAVVAGAATLLAQARPELSAAELRAALSESAHPLAGEPLLAQGAGELDLARAATLPAIALPATLDLGLATRQRRWHVTQQLVVRNTTRTRLALYVSTHATGAAAAVILEPTPAVLRLAPGQTRTLSLLVRFRPGPIPHARSAQGILRLATPGGEALRIPWTLALPAPAQPLVRDITLSKQRFQVSASVPAVLALDAGRVVPTASHAADGPARVPAIVPVARLALDLWNADGQRLGTLAALTNVLPGRYSFGITGRSPAGANLSPGYYTIRIIARPLDGSRPTVRKIHFTILQPPPSTVPTLTAP